MKDVKGKVILFVKKAGSIVFLSSIVLWLLLSFSFKLEYGVNVEDSILACIGKCLSFVLYPILGEFSWEATVSSLQGFVAKEQVVSSMAIISNISCEGVGCASVFDSNLFAFFDASSAYGYVSFNLFSAPCVGAVSAMSRELGSKRKTISVVIFQTFVAWVVALFVRFICLLIIGG